MAASKTVYISVTSDLVTDQRVLKIARSLQANHYQVKLIGRRLTSGGEEVLKEFDCKRFRLLFNSGFLFYASFNLRLFFYLLFSKQGIFYANDLDTLPANFLASKIRSAFLVYDSHEYFTEVPELINRPGVQAFWKRIEGFILPRLKNCMTVSSAIAEVYLEKYGVHFQLLRNFPKQKQFPESVQKENFVLYQGALNVGRGLEELIQAMPMVNAKLWIAGSGDIEEELKRKVSNHQLENKVFFLGRLKAEELKVYTQKAKIGLSVEKPIGLNYTYALPNKVFDYIHAGTPVLYAPLVEIKTTLSGFQIGEELVSYHAEKMAKQLNAMLKSDRYSHWQKECERAAQIFNWQKEERVLLSIFEELS